MEDIVLVDCLLSRGKGTKMEGGNGVRLSADWMGMDLADEMARIRKYHIYI